MNDPSLSPARKAALLLVCLAASVAAFCGSCPDRVKATAASYKERMQ
jgi:hypothetical protein